MRYNINNLISAVADYSNMKDTKPSMKKQKISDAVIHRLPRYYRYLDDLYNKGVVRISSSLLGSKMDITASQIRQDLSCFGEFGQQGYGYNVAELRADIEKRIRDEKQAGIDRAFENAAVEKAAANMTVEIPDSMIDEELDQEMERMDYELRSQGASLQAYAQMMGGDMNAIRNSLRPSAQAAVRTNVLLDAVAAAENIEVSEEECEEEYKKLAESYKMELDDVKKALNADGLKSDLKLRKAARLIADSAVAVAPKAPEAAEEAPASEE